MRFVRPLAALFVAIGLAAPALQAQDAPADTARTRRVTLRDGRVVTGRIAGETTDGLTVVDASGVRTTVPADQIRRISAPITSRFTRQDPNDTRLFFSPTARTLPRGAGRFTTYYIFLPSVAYGLTGRVDVSAATSIPLLGFGGSDVDFAGVVSGNVKVGVVQTERAAFAVGLNANTVYGADADGVIGTFYGTGTIGTPESALTFGAYGVYAAGEDVDLDVGDGVALLVGYERQLTNNVKLISENVVTVPLVGNDALDDGPEAGSVHLLGVRFFAERLAADFALIGALNTFDDGFRLAPIPYVSFAYNFGR